MLLCRHFLDDAGYYYLRLPAFAAYASAFHAVDITLSFAFAFTGFVTVFAMIFFITPITLR